MASILVVDDDRQIREMLAEFLEEKGFTVITATNGKDALKLIAASTVDLLITDLIMPEKEGLELIMELKNAKSAIKIIAISGGIPGLPMDFLPIARNLGAARVFSKPVDRHELLACIKELLAS